MKVLVIEPRGLFVHDDVKALAASLMRQLSARPDIEAELARIPFRGDPPLRLIDDMLACQTMRLPRADRVIALAFPAYLIPHPRKTLWLLHPFRPIFDLDEADEWRHTPEAAVAREAVRRTDETSLRTCERLFAGSQGAWDHLAQFNAIEPEMLRPPLDDPELFVGGPNGDYLLAAGRVCEASRLHLLIEAMALAGREARLVIAGPPESWDYARRLRGLVARHGLQDRVRLALRRHTRRETAALINGALACACMPLAEDAYREATGEAFAAGKAVLTTDDSHGPSDLVDAGTGLVTAPSAAALAEGVSRLFADREATAALGRNARAAFASKMLGWDDTLERLLAA